ncbi:hypothetical protein DPMN_157954 [Dreissena polymorpha]|uniref:Uncharacterized protein n=1 Tax=Dreissena polymorpha TaxID=45954 RepID=A0A9D4EGF0_DREPO|nr:hypothetical protein DPMN_157954 [Dreissena polymorpha]
MGASILQCIRDDSGSYRKLKELSWIQKLKTEVPNGLNTKSTSEILWQHYRQ